jgi:hypothetical protein
VARGGAQTPARTSSARTSSTPRWT